MKRPRLSHEPQRSRIDESLDTALSARARMASGLGTTSASTGKGQRCAKSRMRARRRPELETGASRKMRAPAGASAAELAADEVERGVGLVDRVVAAAQAAGQIAHGAVGAVEDEAARERDLDGDDEVEAVDEQRAAARVGALDGARRRGASAGRASRACGRSATRWRVSSWW